MKQIKTIEFDDVLSPIFDSEVNEALENGWKLVKRFRSEPVSPRDNAKYIAYLEKDVELQK